MEAISTHNNSLLALPKGIFLQNTQQGSTAHSRGWRLKGFSLLSVFIFLTGANGWGQAVLLDPAGSGGFEGAHGWTLTAYGANENRWIVGAAQKTANTSGLYMVSWNATTTYGYASNNSSTGSHAYISVSFPAGATNIVLKFKVKGGCDLYLGSCYDRVKVGFSSSAPTGNSEGGITNVWNQTSSIAAYTLQTVNLSSATYAGTTKNLVITWINDGSGAVTAGAIDEVSITYTAACSAPTVAATTASSSVTACSASTGGNVTADGGCAVTARGVCYGTSANPTTANTTVTASGTTGSFTSALTGLLPATTYYVRAYATNSSGTTYGTEASFTTSAAVPVPTAVSASRCGPGTVQLGVETNINGTINWYTNVGLTTLATNGTVVACTTPNPCTTYWTTPSISSTTTYYATRTNASGCRSAGVAVTATVNPIPTITIAVTESSGTTNDGQLCAPGVNATLTASGGSTYSWTGGPSTAANAVAPSSTTSYTVTGTSSGCTATTSATLTVSAAVATTFYSKATGNLNDLSTWGSNTDGTGCNPSNFTTAGTTYIIQNNTAPTTSGTWTVSGAGSIIKVGNSSSSVTFLAGGTLSFDCDLEITANATLNLASNNLTLSGDFIRSSTTALFSQNAGSSSTVEFSGSSQNVNVTANNGTIPTDTDITFNNITISGSGVKLFYYKVNDRKLNINNFTVNNGAVVTLYSNPQ
jgi:hypothetical protein